MKKNHPATKRKLIRIAVTHAEHERKAEEAIPNDMGAPPKPPARDIENFLVEELQSMAQRRRYLRDEARTKALQALRMRENPSLDRERGETERYALAYDCRWSELSEAIRRVGALFSAHTGREFIDLHEQPNAALRAGTTAVSIS